MASDREYMEVLVGSIDKRITGMDKNIIDRMDIMEKNTCEKFEDIKITVKDNAKDIDRIKNAQSKTSGIFTTIRQTASLIWLAIITYFQVKK